jgi:hypothetical protein
MHVLPLVNIEASFVVFVGDSVSDSSTEHALSALHVIVHYVLHFGLKRLFIDQIEVNVVLGGDLDSDVTFDKVNETPDVDLVVLFP